MMNASPAPQEIFLLKLGEVVLKGLNRQSFEDKLLANVRRRLKNCGSFQCSLRQSTIYVEPQGEDVRHGGRLGRLPAGVRHRRRGPGRAL